MVTLTKLVDRLTGYTICEKAPLKEYLTLAGIEYFEEKRWKHTFVRIPSRLVNTKYREQFVCFCLETEESTVGEIAKYRSLFYNDDLLVTLNSGKELYHGRAGNCPQELHSLTVSRTMYDNTTMMLEVSDV